MHVQCECVVFVGLVKQYASLTHNCHVVLLTLSISVFVSSSLFVFLTLFLALFCWDIQGNMMELKVLCTVTGVPQE